MDTKAMNSGRDDVPKTMTPEQKIAHLALHGCGLYLAEGMYPRFRIKRQKEYDEHVLSWVSYEHNSIYSTWVISKSASLEFYKSISYSELPEDILAQLSWDLIGNFCSKL